MIKLSVMSEATNGNAMIEALRAAGARLASSNIHGRYHLKRRPGRSAVVTFAGQFADTLQDDIQALAEAVLALRAAGFEAERFGHERVVVRARRAA